MIVYVVSNKKMFGGRLDVEQGTQLLNDQVLYDGEHYLYRQEWGQDWQDQNHLNHEDFAKVVDDKWLFNHSLYYGCPVLDGINQNELQTKYDEFVESMNSNY